MLKLNTETIYQSVQQALHTTISTRQSRKGEISSWKAFAPAHAGKLAIEAVDRSMRGEGAPSPIYEGEDSIVARILDGKNALYNVPLPKKNESKKAILETYTKEYSAEYQAQALIDIAKKLNRKISNLNQIKKIDLYTSHHTHNVIGTGANDPQKMDPNASRETLDHSIMYIFAVALEDADWHHVKSYTKQRANRKSTIKIWKSIITHEDKKWTKKYHDPNPKNKSFGAKVVITLNNGKKSLYHVPLPKKSESKKAILETYTKEYSAEYQAQALIDIAKKLNKKIPNLNQIKKIDLYTSHHTHYVIGTGANDPQKMDPNASRETLDHSIMYIFAVALEDADWHHVKSYTKKRANKKSTIKIWKSIITHEDKKWTKKYHDPNPKNKSFGGKVIVTMNNGKKIIEQLDRADAHPYGTRPFKRQNYIQKFLTLTDGILDKKESLRFLKDVQNLKNLKSGELNKLNIQLKRSQIKKNTKKGIF